MLKPDKEHHKPLVDVLGCETTEADMPSGNIMTVAKTLKKLQVCPNTVLVVQNVCSTVSCFKCDKPRCIYSKKALMTREERCLKRLLEKYTYSCGPVITPDGDSLQGKVFVRLQLGCRSPLRRRTTLHTWPSIKTCVFIVA
ncbi:uncharacterized protein LOC127881900 [Dreissena polymorpha]|uniref:uncharacterized protein LOC127881900 n=1 Tax=Dreissena polymorpha TaxID=45954 RepID=UPI002264A47B|nr:uncharacterized protein LOC127881900 [Dreissena polymorpha]